ncbi:MAG: glycosyltransferase family 2 protein [Candidatus Nealsonbacteria bacterium]|nr:glycosyltransferase family 2 protein [Candidatus Nealsonbacteria bacterium]
MTNKISVSAIIPCFERADELRRLLISLKKQDFPNPWEIIVVDDGSKNAAEIKTAAEEFQCSLIRLDENVGPAEARNIGVKKANGEFLWFLDSDSEAENQLLLNNLASCLRQNKSLAGVGGEAAEINGTLYSNSLHPLPNWLPLAKYLPLNKPFELRPKFISTNNLLISKNDFWKCGGFDPYFDMCEDQDLCLRLAKGGKFFLVRNDTCAIHHHSPAGREGGTFWFFNNAWNYAKNMHQSRMKMIFRHFPYLLPVLPLLDVIFTPIVFIAQMFFVKRRSSDLLKEKIKNGFRGFPVFVLFNLAAMFLAWLTAGKMILKLIIKP